MADNTLNISPPFKFEIKTPPRGMTDYDPSAIHPDQQEQLNSYKLNLMRENIHFFARHLEIKGIIYWVGEHFWSFRPREVLPLLGKRFAMPEKKLRREVAKIISRFNVHVEEEMVESEEEDWDY